MNVSIIIVSWKVRDQLKSCLESLKENTHNINYEIFVVDNNSNDGTVELIKSSFKDVNLIINQKNQGFSYACNQAIKISKGDYILLLNPDTKVNINSINQMIDFMFQRDDCGIAGCKIINEDGSIQPSVRKFPDFYSHSLILLKIHNFFTNIKSIQNYYLSNFDYNKVQTVDQVMGAFFMIKKRVIEEIGLLDENYYIWYEEVDFCKRALIKSWKTYYNPDVTIFHQKGASFSQMSSLRKQYIFNRSMLHYFFKFSNTLAYLILLLITPISLILALLTQILKFKKKRKDL